MLRIFPDVESLSRAAAELFVEIGDRAIADRGRFAVALAGGSTPKTLYRILADEEYRHRLDWSRTVFFIGDERNVPPDDPESNFRMVSELLFEPLGVEANCVYPWKTEIGDVGETAADYEAEIRQFFSESGSLPTYAGGTEIRPVSRMPRFDLVLLGLGADGHTASLFPFSETVMRAASGTERRIAVENRVEKFNDWRYTLTVPAINSSANVVFLVAGESKADALREILAGEARPEEFPAMMIRPEGGHLVWLADEDAAGLLPEDLRAK